MSSPTRTGEAVISSQLKPAPAKNLINEVKDGKVVAAMNGGFFNAYYNTSGVKFPENYPRIYGTVVSNGKVLNGGDISGVPGLVFDTSGKAHIGYVSVTSYLEVNGEKLRTYTGVNNISSKCFTEDMKAQFYAEKGERVNYIKNGIFNGSVESGGVNIKTEPGMMIVLGHYNWKKGDSVKLTYSTVIDSEDVDAMTIITCGPMLLHDGENTASKGGSYDEKQNANSVAQRSFAAIAPDGKLILGEVSSSPNKIATYLQGQGVKDAMLFDGGASSMLYNADRGFVQPAGRNLASVFMIVDKYKADNTAKSENTKPATPVYTKEVNLEVNGEKVNFPENDAKPVIIDNRTYVPVRVVADALGINIGWDTKISEITFTRNDVKVTHIRGSSVVCVNGKTIQFDTHSINEKNRTLMPVRMIAESVGANVAWDSSTETVKIYT